MTHDDKVSQLRQHEDYRRAVIGGKEREFCLCRYGSRLAKERGVDILDEGLSGIESIVAHLYAGVVAFDLDLTFDDFSDLLSLKEIVRLGPLTRIVETPQNGHVEAPGAEGNAVGDPATA